MVFCQIPGFCTRTINLPTGNVSSWMSTQGFFNQRDNQFRLPLVNRVLLSTNWQRSEIRDVVTALTGRRAEGTESSTTPYTDHYNRPGIDRNMNTALQASRPTPQSRPTAGKIYVLHEHNEWTSHLQVRLEELACPMNCGTWRRACWT